MKCGIEETWRKEKENEKKIEGNMRRRRRRLK